jgi:maltooligosyltrehalose trehalohydrolase
MVQTIERRPRKQVNDKSSRHSMPFGARLLPDGRVQFRLWAPAAKKVELCLQTKALRNCVQMTKESNGWYGVISDQASADSYYQYRINEKTYVPDPASRFQPQDVEGASQVIDPGEWQWQENDWRGRPWEDVVCYEIHVGTFTPKGSFSGVKERLDYLIDLGITAIQLMPIADFPGKRNWGYDGALLFAPDSAYGTPNELKELIQTAHAKGIMVFLDVVYNHFGPKGNYLHLYAPEFFTNRHHTPWGSAINFDGQNSGVVRQFFIHNALYWLEEYHFDGLRFDAVHAIYDDSRPDILEELSAKVALGPGRERSVHLVLENDNNAAHYLRPQTKSKGYFTAQWNDDIHHVLHVLLTEETSGYYQDYASSPLQHLARCLTSGFAYQGEASLYRDGRRRGEPSSDLPCNSFVAFLQNHDQVGNRALGERISALCCDQALHAATAIFLLAPSTPLLFMGQEWAAAQAFPYFVDFDAELAAAVTKGRLAEFSRFPQFKSHKALQDIPLPNDAATFQQAKLNWRDLAETGHQYWLECHRRILQIRKQVIQPRLAGTHNSQTHCELAGTRAVMVHWRMADDCRLSLVANMSKETQSCDWSKADEGDLLYSTHDDFRHQLQRQLLQPWAVGWFLAAAARP